MRSGQLRSSVSVREREHPSRSVRVSRLDAATRSSRARAFYSIRDAILRALSFCARLLTRLDAIVTSLQLGGVSPSGPIDDLMIDLTYSRCNAALIIYCVLK